MTLEGTNTWVLRAPGGRECVVVDPGERDDEHQPRGRRAAGPWRWCCSTTATTTTRGARGGSRS